MGSRESQWILYSTRCVSGWQRQAQLGDGVHVEALIIAKAFILGTVTRVREPVHDDMDGVNQCSDDKRGNPAHQNHRKNADLLRKGLNDQVPVGPCCQEASWDDDGEQHNQENETPIEVEAAFENAMTADGDPRRDNKGYEEKKALSYQRYHQHDAPLQIVRMDRIVRRDVLSRSRDKSPAHNYGKSQAFSTLKKRSP
jgi:hypothetical protein